MNNSRNDMDSGLEPVNLHMSALAARWGLINEEACKESLRKLLEKKFGFKVERWEEQDEKGKAFGYPGEVELDL